MNKKPTGAIIDERIYVVAQLLLRSMMRHEIVQYAAEKWGVRTRQADEYIKKARKLLLDGKEETLKRKKAMRMRELDYLYGESFNVKNYSVCLGVKKLQCELEGLIVKKVDGSVKFEERGIEDYSEDEIKQALRELE